MANLSDISTILEDAKRGQYISLKCNKTSSDFDAIVVDEGLSRVQSIAVGKWEKGWPVMPYDAEVEYLERTDSTTAGPYIITDISGSNDLDFEIKAQPYAVGAYTCFGARYTWGGVGANIYNLVIAQNGHFGFGYNTQWYSWPVLNLSANQDFTAYKSGNFVSASTGVSFTVTSDEFSTPYPMEVFAMATATQLRHNLEGFYGRIYSLSFSRNGAKVADFIPVRVGTVGYMYDKVSGKLFGNANTTGAFTLGPDKYDKDGVFQFSALEAGATVSLVKNGSPADIQLVYSTDGKTWSDYTVGTVLTCANERDFIQFKSNGSTTFSSSTADYYKFNTPNLKKFAVSGNLQYLIDPTGKRKDVPARAFYQLFGSTSVVDASALSLPATDLTTYCYDQMFRGSTLTAAPELPATELCSSCYNQMFLNCTKLSTAPELPSTTLASNCYQGMFSGCSALTSAPELPAISTMAACYVSMFYGCKSLTDAPALPATTIRSQCYESMFDSCTSLTSAPVLPAMAMSTYCYRYMFKQCYALSTPPALPASALDSYCYTGMFNNCTSLTSAPMLSATMLKANCYSSMFSGCASLSTAPELPATTLANNCYGTMFQNCISLESAPALQSTSLTTDCYNSMFYGCSKLTSAPELPATTIAAQCYYQMFRDCIALSTAQSILPAMTLQSKCYWNMFNNCRSLTATPVLPATTLAEYCYSTMFGGCSSLVSATSLPAETPATGCYYYMFSACKSLSSGIDIGLTSLGSGGNGYATAMFVNSSKFNRLSVHFTEWPATYNTELWLQGVSANGDFYCPSELSDARGVSYIPENWTKIDI